MSKKLDNGGMTGAFLVINAADGRVMGDCDTREEADDLCVELQDGQVLYFVAMRVQNTSDATAVAENYVPEGQPMPCGDALVLLSLADRTSLVVAGTALRAPASEGEAVAWCVVRDTKTVPDFDAEGTTRLLRTEEIAHAEAQRYMAHYGSGHSAIPLFTHPAPATVTEAMVQAFAQAWDGQKRLEKNNYDRIRVALTAALGGAR